MPAKIKKKKQISPQLNLLRVLPDEKAFYFYEAIGRPTGMKANSLGEFSAKLKEVDLTSIKFHSERQDFENWIKMLGDPVLVEQISSLMKKPTSDNLQTDLSEIVESRLNLLRKDIL